MGAAEPLPPLKEVVVQVSKTFNWGHHLTVESPYSYSITNVKQLVSMVSIDLLYQFFIPICLQGRLLNLPRNLLL